MGGTPWHVEESNNLFVANEDGNWVAQVDGISAAIEGETQLRANADLIARAPTMRETLEHLAEVLETAGPAEFMVLAAEARAALES